LPKVCHQCCKSAKRKKVVRKKIRIKVLPISLFSIDNATKGKGT
jgi:hypothetical protein